MVSMNSSRWRSADISARDALVVEFASAFSNLQYPIGVLVFPATAVMVGGLEGRSFTFREIGDMIEDSFLMALQSLAATLTQFRETVRGIFG